MQVRVLLEGTDQLLAIPTLVDGTYPVVGQIFGDYEVDGERAPYEVTSVDPSPAGEFEGKPVVCTVRVKSRIS